MKIRFLSGNADGRQFWQQPAWQLSAAFFAFLLSVGIFIVLSGGPEADESKMSPTGGPDQSLVIDTGPLSAGDASAGSRRSVCRTDDADQSTPVRPPRDLRWKPLNGGKIPLSASAGPRITDDSVLWCFAHTPMGAIMAVNVIPRQMSGEAWEAVTELQVMPGIGRDLFKAMRADLPSTPAQYVAVSIGGFMLVSYTPTTATVRLLLEQGADFGAVEYSVVWDSGDWKLQASNVGDLHTPVIPVRSAAGFVLWKA